MQMKFCHASDRMMLLIALPWFKNKQKPPNRFIYWQIKMEHQIFRIVDLEQGCAVNH